MLATVDIQDKPPFVHIGQYGSPTLTLHEVTMLEVAARLFAALREHTAHPPPPSLQEYWYAKVVEELVCPSPYV
jgi:hypothetical protein